MGDLGLELVVAALAVVLVEKFTLVVVVVSDTVEAEPVVTLTSSGSRRGFFVLCAEEHAGGIQTASENCGGNGNAEADVDAPL